MLAQMIDGHMRSPRSVFERFEGHFDLGVYLTRHLDCQVLPYKECYRRRLLGF